MASTAFLLDVVACVLLSAAQISGYVLTTRLRLKLADHPSRPARRSMLVIEASMLPVQGLLVWLSLAVAVNSPLVIFPLLAGIALAYMQWDGPTIGGLGFGKHRLTRLKDPPSEHHQPISPEPAASPPVISPAPSIAVFPGPSGQLSGASDVPIPPVPTTVSVHVRTDEAGVFLVVMFSADPDSIQQLTMLANLPLVVRYVAAQWEAPLDPERRTRVIDITLSLLLAECPSFWLLASDEEIAGRLEVLTGAAQTDQP